MSMLYIHACMGVIFSIKFLDGRSYVMIEKVNSNNFQEKVLDAKGKVLVDFSATWCGPCRALSPVLENIAEEHSSKVSIYSLDIDENKQLAQQYRISAVPAMLVFENGESTGALVGLQTKEAIEKFLSLS